MGDNYYKPTAKKSRHWVKAAAETVAELESHGVGEDRWLDWLEYALRQHNNNMLRSGKDPYVKSTGTLEYLVESFAKTENLDRYLIGVEDE